MHVPGDKQSKTKRDCDRHPQIASAVWQPAGKWLQCRAIMIRSCQGSPTWVLKSARHLSGCSRGDSGRGRNHTHCKERTKTRKKRKFTKKRRRRAGTSGGASHSARKSRPRRIPACPVCGLQGRRPTWAGCGVLGCRAGAISMAFGEHLENELTV